MKICLQSFLCQITPVFKLCLELIHLPTWMCHKRWGSDICLVLVCLAKKCCSGFLLLHCHQVGKVLMLSVLHVFLFHRKFPWIRIFVHLGKGFRLLYATSWGGGFLTVAEEGFHCFKSTGVVVRTPERAQLWTWSMATIISQIFAHEFFVQFCCVEDCCCFWGEGREQGEKIPHESVKIHLPSVSAAY